MAEHYFLLRIILIYTSLGMAAIFLLAGAAYEITARIREHRLRKKVTKTRKNHN